MASLYAVMVIAMENRHHALMITLPSPLFLFNPFRLDCFGSHPSSCRIDPKGHHGSELGRFQSATFSCDVDESWPGRGFSSKLVEALFGLGKGILPVLMDFPLPHPFWMQWEVRLHRYHPDTSPYENSRVGLTDMTVSYT